MREKLGRSFVLEIEGVGGQLYTFTSPLTIEFTVSRNCYATANTASIKILNISSASRDALYKDQMDISQLRTVLLRAGYGDLKTLPVIFFGSVMSCSSYRESGAVDYVTEIECLDGVNAIRNAYSSFTLPEGVDQSSFFARLALDMKPYGVNKGTIAPSFNRVFYRPITVNCFTWNILQTDTALRAFIDNQTVHALGDGDCLRGDVAEISSDTGLLGTPKKAQNTMVVNMIFEPRLTSGQVVTIKTDSPQPFLKSPYGQYKVIGFRHAGTISDAVCGKVITQAICYAPKDLKVVS